MWGPGHQVEISDSIELCIVELTRVDCNAKPEPNTNSLITVLRTSFLKYLKEWHCSSVGRAQGC